MFWMRKNHVTQGLYHTMKCMCSLLRAPQGDPKDLGWVVRIWMKLWSGKERCRIRRLVFFVCLFIFFHLMEHLKHFKYLQHLEHFVPFPWFDSRSFSVTPGCAEPCAVLLWEVWTACDRLCLAIYRASYCGSTRVLNVMPWGQAV